MDKKDIEYHEEQMQHLPPIHPHYSSQQETVELTKAHATVVQAYYLKQICDMLSGLAEMLKENG